MSVCVRVSVCTPTLFWEVQFLIWEVLGLSVIEFFFYFPLTALVRNSVLSLQHNQRNANKIGKDVCFLLVSLPLLFCLVLFFSGLFFLEATSSWQNRVRVSLRWGWTCMSLVEMPLSQPPPSPSPLQKVLWLFKTKNPSLLEGPWIPLPTCLTLHTHPELGAWNSPEWSEEGGAPPGKAGVWQQPSSQDSFPSLRARVCLYVWGCVYFLLLILLWSWSFFYFLFFCSFWGGFWFCFVTV